MPLPPENLVDLAEALRHATYAGAIWSLNCEQLNVNLMRLADGEGIPEHVNGELDVLLAVFEGEGVLVVDGVEHAFSPGVIAVVPRGVSRAISCRRGPLVYLTCHKQRGGLMPI